MGLYLVESSSVSMSAPSMLEIRLQSAVICERVCEVGMRDKSRYWVRNCEVDDGRVVLGDCSM